MRLLLDTNVFIWTTETPDKLSRRAAKAISDPENERWVSLASVWEIAIKLTLKKLKIRGSFNKLPGILAIHAMNFIPLEFKHLARLNELPLHHRDPFDRLLIAQALEEQLTVVSPDPEFKRYGAPCLW
jgi:PIN domain nuclease of toxin-antitoxin system